MTPAEHAQRIRYTIRDIATEGTDFLIWGDNDLAAAIYSLAQCHCDGIGHDVELIVEVLP